MTTTQHSPTTATAYDETPYEDNDSSELLHLLQYVSDDPGETRHRHRAPHHGAPHHGAPSAGGRRNKPAATEQHAGVMVGTNMIAGVGTGTITSADTGVVAGAGTGIAGAPPSERRRAGTLAIAGLITAIPALGAGIGAITLELTGQSAQESANATGIGAVGIAGGFITLILLLLAGIIGQDDHSAYIRAILSYNQGEDINWYWLGFSSPDDQAHSRKSYRDVSAGMSALLLLIIPTGIAIIAIGAGLWIALT